MDVNRLVEILKKVNKGEIAEKNALKKIKEASPLDLTMAEEKILIDGLDDRHLQKFCRTHLDAIEEKMEDVKVQLSDQHPLFKLVEEHEKIIETVDNLDYLAGIMEDRDLDLEEIETLEISVDNLGEKESHHEREEELIFPEIKKKKINLSVEDLEKDHEEITPKVERLKEFIEEPNEYKQEILDLIYDLSFNIRRHVFQENVILYPAVLNAVEDWDAIAAESEKIGYCTFK